MATLDLPISTIGFGASVLGLVYGDPDEQPLADAVDAAIEAGITFFDTSPYYGATRAEAVLGNLLRGRRRRVLLCTKAGRLGEDAFDFSAAAIRDSVAASLQRLQTDYLDVLIAHDIEFGHPDQILHETYDALVRLKEEGVCRAIGMSGYPLSILTRAVRECELDVVLSYCHGTLWDTRVARELVPAAELRGTVVINASPLGMGLLTHAGPQPWHPAGATLKAACRAADAACTEAGAPIEAVALRHALALRGISCTLVGMRSPAEVRENLAAIGSPPHPTAYQAALSVLAPVRDTGWLVGNARWG